MFEQIAKLYQGVKNLRINCTKLLKSCEKQPNIRFGINCGLNLTLSVSIMDGIPSTSITSLVSEQSREGPGNGGIPRSELQTSSAEQSREGPSNGGISGSASKRGVKRKLESKTLEEKYRAILEVEKGQKSKTEIAKMFNVPKNTLSGWVKKAESIKKGFEKFGPKRRNMRNGEFEDLEKVLLKWFKQMRDRDIPISGPLLLEKAKYFADSLEINDF